MLRSCSKKRFARAIWRADRSSGTKKAELTMVGATEVHRKRKPKLSSMFTKRASVKKLKPQMSPSMTTTWSAAFMSEHPLLASKLGLAGSKMRRARTVGSTPEAKPTRRSRTAVFKFILSLHPSGALVGMASPSSAAEVHKAEVKIDIVILHMMTK